MHVGKGRPPHRRETVPRLTHTRAEQLIHPVALRGEHTEPQADCCDHGHRERNPDNIDLLECVPPLDPRVGLTQCGHSVLYPEERGSAIHQDDLVVLAHSADVDQLLARGAGYVLKARQELPPAQPPHLFRHVPRDEA